MAQFRQDMRKCEVEVFCNVIGAVGFLLGVVRGIGPIADREDVADIAVGVAEVLAAAGIAVVQRSDLRCLVGCAAVGDGAVGIGRGEQTVGGYSGVRPKPSYEKLRLAEPLRPVAIWLPLSALSSSARA